MPGRPEGGDVDSFVGEVHGYQKRVIRDLEEQALAHFPSGQLNANAAWTVSAAVAHNLLRWTEL